MRSSSPVYDTAKVPLLLLLLNWTAEFPRLVMPIEWAPIHLSMEEVTVSAGHEVLTFISLIVGDPQGILDHHIKLNPIILLNIIII